MRRFWFSLCIFLVISTASVTASQTLTGFWVSADGKTSYEIIDGFKANRGAVLAIYADSRTELGSWEFIDGSYELHLGWYSDKVTFVRDDVIQYRREAYTRNEDIGESEVISVKTNQASFIDKLTSTTWQDVENNRTVNFRTTFSSDSGVVEQFSIEGELEGFNSWGVGSGIFKIGSMTLIESRVSDQYIIGMEQSDSFMVYKSNGSASQVDRTNIKEERDLFFAALTTDAWFTVGSYTPVTIHRFRPIESELKGRVIQTRDDKLYTWNVWEYSPDSGAIRIGYTSYIGAVLVGDTMAFIDSSGDQQYYRRVIGGDNHRFTLGDVTSIPLSENNIEKIATLLNGQFQVGEYIYRFEFSENSLEGRLHKFVSEPFKIIGNRFNNTVIGNSQRLWAVEDVVIFDERNLLKRDTQKVWLKPLSEQEAVEMLSATKAATQSLMEKHVIVRVRTKDGKTIDVELPISNFSEIVDLALLVE
jgi:hypothetical protein